jgi:hypothetical protein
VASSVELAGLEPKPPGSAAELMRRHSRRFVVAT